MAVLPHTHIALKYPPPPLKRRRRTATSVMAGDFDPRPRVDVLTCLLNGVKPYRPPLTEEQLRARVEQKEKRKEKQQEVIEERERKKKEKSEKKDMDVTTARLNENGTIDVKDGKKSRGSSAGDSGGSKEHKSSFWQALPPREDADILESTPEPSDDDSSSRTSSKRPHTPTDETIGRRSSSTPYSPTSPLFKDSVSLPIRRPGRPPKKRRILKYGERATSQPDAEKPTVPSQPKLIRKRSAASRKGWKGWIEASEDEMPRDKLIQIDQAIILHDRRTRSGKNFDAISEGKDTWV